MPVTANRPYPVKLTFNPADNPEQFQGDYAGRETRVRHGIMSIAELAERFPDQDFMDCLYQDFMNAEEEYIKVDIDHLSPDSSAVLPRLQQRLRRPPAAAPDSVTKPSAKLRQPRDLDPAVAAELLYLYAQFYYAFQPDSSADSPELAEAVELARQAGITLADLEKPECH